MRRFVPHLLATCVVLLIAITLTAGLPHVATGSWSSAASMAVARNGAASVQLPDGKILVTGGQNSSGILGSAELFGTDGTFSAAQPMSMGRVGHATVLLPDGRVLVSGGQAADGTVTSSAETYDVISGMWTTLPATMQAARSGHTATLMLDGTVLIAGGQDASGNPVGTLEVFDPVTDQFTSVGSLITPRMNHVAAALQNGNVIIAGGTGMVSGAPVTLVSTEIYDLNNGAISAGPGLATARAKATATTQLDGKVFIAGGSNPEAMVNGIADLGSTEIYDPAAGTISAGPVLNTPRSGHQAFLLPNNNNILIVGGSAAGVDLGSAELYRPWTNTIQSTGSMAAARSSATGAPVLNTNLLLVAGGSNLASAELYGYATVKTDQGDYPPGSIVTITGSGWQPGETVTLNLVESPNIDMPGPYKAVADAYGNITNSSFVTDSLDVNVRFYLTASGSASQAQTTFTDAPGDTTDVTSVSCSPNPVTTGSSTTCTAVVANTTGTNGYPQGSVTFGFVTGSNPASATCPSSSMTPVNSTTSSCSVSVAPQVAISGKVTANFNALDNRWKNSNGNSLNYTLTVNAPTCTAASVTNPANQTITYGQDATFTVTASGNPTPTIQWQANTGSGWNAVGSGTSFTVVKPSVSASGTQYRAVATNTCNGTQAATSNAATLTVDTAALTITANNASKTYGQTVTFGGTEFTTTGLLNSDTVTSVTLTSAGAAATATVGGSPYAIAPSSAVGTGLSNYSITYVNGTLTVNTAALTITANNASKTYGQTLTFTGTEFTASGLVNGDAVTSVTLTSSGAAATVPVSGSPYAIVPSTAVGTGLSNYTISYVNGNLTVNPATLTITAKDATKTYGQTLTFTGTEFTVSGLVNGDTVTSVTLTSNGAAATATVGGSPYAIAPSAAVGAGLANYSITYVNGKLTVNPAPLTITAKDTSKTYGQTITFSGTEFTASGLVSGDTVTSVTLTSTGTAATAGVAGSPYPIVPSNAAGTGLSNYTITYVNGSLTVNPAPLTIAANNATKIYGQTLTFAGTEFTTSGLLFNTDTVTSVSLTSAGAVATASVTGSPYAIVIGTAVGTGLGNYTITYVNGVLTIKQATTTVTVATATGSPNPSLLGQSVTFTATVAPQFSGTPTGTIQFQADGSNWGAPATLVSGVAQSSVISGLSAGVHTITAVYSGDSNFIGSSGSAQQGVNYNLCLLYDTTKAAKSGSTIPIKLQLCDVNGGNASSSSIILHATNLVQMSSSAPFDVTDAGNANPDNDFRYDPTLQGYIFNLQTTGLASGAWQMLFTVSTDGTALVPKATPHATGFYIR